MAALVINALMYFTLKEMLAKYTSLKFNALLTRLLNKQIVYLAKNPLIALLFYDHSSVPHITTQKQLYIYFTHLW